MDDNMNVKRSKTGEVVAKGYINYYIKAYTMLATLIFTKSQFRNYYVINNINWCVFSKNALIC